MKIKDIKIGDKVQISEDRGNRVVRYNTTIKEKTVKIYYNQKVQEGKEFKKQFNN